MWTLECFVLILSQSLVHIRISYKRLFVINKDFIRVEHGYKISKSKSNSFNINSICNISICNVLAGRQEDIIQRRYLLY